MLTHHDATIETLDSISSADLGDNDACWVGWYTPEGTQNTRMVGLTSLDSTVHVMTDDECRYIQAAAEYNSNGYAAVWAEMIK